MLKHRLGFVDDLFSCGGGSTPQTNDNQAAVVTAQTTETTGLTTAQTGLAQAIINDAGNDVPNVPTPPNIPSVGAVSGDTDRRFIQDSSAQGATQESGFISDPIVTGLLNTFNDSANGEEGDLLVAGAAGNQSLTANQSQTQTGLTSSESATDAAIATAESTASAGISASANGANLPLGVQASYAPVTTTDGTASSGGGISLLPILLLAGGGFGIWFLIKHEHHAA